MVPTKISDRITAFDVFCPRFHFEYTPHIFERRRRRRKCRYQVCSRFAQYSALEYVLVRGSRRISGLIDCDSFDICAGFLVSVSRSANSPEVTTVWTCTDYAVIRRGRLAAGDRNKPHGRESSAQFCSSSAQTKYRMVSSFSKWALLS